MDVDAVVRRAPELALIDELAHTNAPGIAEREALPGHRRDPRRRHRRDLDGQHPASREPERRDLRADRRPRARDVPRPRAQRRRRGRPRRSLARGAAGASARAARSTRASAAEAALQNFFRDDNLSTLRELALREVAEDVEARRQAAELDPLSKQAVGRARARPRRAAADARSAILRRAWRSAQRSAREIDALWVQPAGRASSTARTSDPARRAASARRRSSACTSSRRRATISSTRYGGSSSSAARPTSSSARRTSARWVEIVRGSLVSRMIRELPGIDIRVVAAPGAARRAPRMKRSRPTPAPPAHVEPGQPRLLVPFTARQLDPTVLDAAIADRAGGGRACSCPPTSSSCRSS